VYIISKSKIDVAPFSMRSLHTIAKDTSNCPVYLRRRTGAKTQALFPFRALYITLYKELIINHFKDKHAVKLVGVPYET
jgi:hypothetical protein